MSFIGKEQKVVRVRRSSFSPLFRHHLQSSDYDFYDEHDFRAIVQRERKRTERSKRPFLLMLVDAVGFSNSKGRARTLEKIAFALCSCSRKMDSIGWYRNGNVFGALFVELGSDVREGRRRISDKVARTFGATLRADEVQKLKVSFHPYPEHEDHDKDDRSLFDLCLYPDLSRREQASKVSLVFKRIMDFLGSACALIILSPLFATIAVGVKLSSRGPVFYGQTRIGFGGRPFTLYKFRSMYVNCDPSDHMDYVKKFIGGETETAVRTEGGRAGEKGVYKLKNDRRVTGFGRWLRKTSLDELPQFFNVLKGDMALVGPRPPISYECESYEVWHRRRVLEVKPGLTGLWQVKGRSRTTFDDMVRLDLKYAREWSLWLDIRILFQTPATVIHGKGAY